MLSFKYYEAYVRRRHTPVNSKVELTSQSSASRAEVPCEGLVPRQLRLGEGRGGRVVVVGAGSFFAAKIGVHLQQIVYLAVFRCT